MKRLKKVQLMGTVFHKKLIFKMVNNKLNVPKPIRCDYCNRGWHPNAVFKTKQNKQICRFCLWAKIKKLKNQNRNIDYVKTIINLLNWNDYNKLICNYGVFGDKNIERYFK